MGYQGGYTVIKQDLLRAGMHGHTATLKDPVSAAHLTALNTLQDTPWRINTFVLDVMRDLWLGGRGLGGLPMADDMPLPQNLPDSEWEMMGDEAKKGWKRKKARIYTRNREMVSRRDALLRVLDLAETLRDEEAIYFPHSLDFRGRMYPIPQDLNPQGDDLTKSLLMFATGKPLGRRGYFWLQVHLANCAGQDKLSLADRVKWCQENMRMIMQTGEDPMSTLDRWAAVDDREDPEMDSPFGLVAACREMWMVGEAGFDHVSHLPIQVDGSCNGLQHLSALGRDRKGAIATNVAANEVRQDIYQRVADRCAEICNEDVRRGVEAAVVWQGAIRRKTVKRAVMTTPYGVTSRGIRDQLVNDGHTHKALGENQEGHHKAADYLTSVIQKAMDETVASASSIMGYFQDVTVAFAKKGVPFQWTSPSGMRVQQAYHHLSQRRIDTLYGRVYLNDGDAALGMDQGKQRNGAAPNVIHSFDAAHMVATINFARDVYGITDFSMIHDSYGCHACDMDNLSYTLRRAFVDQYSEDLLGAFHREQLQVAEPMGIDLPEPPALSDFDISEVQRSDFFFA